MLAIFWSRVLVFPELLLGRILTFNGRKSRGFKFQKEWSFLYGRFCHGRLLTNLVTTNGGLDQNIAFFCQIMEETIIHVLRDYT